MFVRKVFDQVTVSAVPCFTTRFQICLKQWSGLSPQKSRDGDVTGKEHFLYLSRIHLFIFLTCFLAIIRTLSVQNFAGKNRFRIKTK